MGLSGAGVLSFRGSLRRHDDVGGLRKSLRSASPQRLRGARHHRDQRGLQQIQAWLDWMAGLRDATKTPVSTSAKPTMWNNCGRSPRKTMAITDPNTGTT